jgi:hypothetical protein
MTTLATRLGKLESKLGGDDMERYLRSLSDEELEARIREIHGRLRAMLTSHGQECGSMPIQEVVDRLTEMEKAEAGHVDAA